MTVELQHAMRSNPTPDEAARGRFVAGMRSFILNELAGDMQRAYERRAAPAFARAHGRAPATSDDAHMALRGDPVFGVYSALRVRAQQAVWQAVAPTVERDVDRLEATAREVAGAEGALVLDPALAVPRNVSSIDVHLMPGSYTAGGNTLAAGAVYDRGLAVFSMGLMGANLDDIGLSMARYVQLRYPDFAPRRILDLGCTIGHNTLPWKLAYPDAEVIGIDAAPAGLRYGSARAKLQGVEVRFEQMLADALAYPDGAFDVVWSSMFLHEISAKTRARVFAEANRVLRPGGLMLHMELPPNKEMGAFEGFYLDWDSHYNAEPFYKGFRDEDPRALCAAAGFAPEDYIQFVVPSIGIYGDDAVAAKVRSEDTAVTEQETTGRLAEGVQWFGFGAWKR